MVRRPAALLTGLLLCLATLALATETGQVARVVDGDALKVAIGGQLETVRLIGVDTPETVHPSKPVEFFGKEASAFTRWLAEEKVVRLAADPEVGDRDRYGPLLRYVGLPDGRIPNTEITAQGHAHEGRLGAVRRPRYYGTRRSPGRRSLHHHREEGDALQQVRRGERRLLPPARELIWDRSFANRVMTKAPAGPPWAIPERGPETGIEERRAFQRIGIPHRCSETRAQRDLSTAC